MADQQKPSSTGSIPTPKDASVLPATTTTASATAALGGTATGETVVVDPVVAKIAGIAAREVPGVFDLGGGAARAIGGIRDAIGQTDLTQGVRVVVGDTDIQAAVTIVALYPQQLHLVAADVRSAVSAAIEEAVGLPVTSVDVTVTDVHVPSLDDDAADETPVVVA